MDLSIIIINWNSKDYVQSCLHSLRSERDLSPCEIIVLDSGSRDGCGDMLRRKFPGVRFVESRENLGFVRANNRAVEYATGETLLFLNPDTEVRGGAVWAMMNALNSLPDAGVVGARLLNTDGSLQLSCVQAFPTVLNQLLGCDFLMRVLPRSRLWGKAALYSVRPGPKEVDAVSGAALMIRRRLFRELGGFSESYFMYSEDIDLCFQSMRSGHRNYHVPEAEILHHGGGSSKRRESRFSSVMKVEAVCLYLRRNRTRAYAWLYRIAMGLSASLRLALLVPAWLGLGLIRRQEPTANSIRKWSYVLGWAAGLDRSGAPMPPGTAL